jgi:hypothetical protein
MLLKIGIANLDQEPLVAYVEWRLGLVAVGDGELKLVAEVMNDEADCMQKGS